MSLLVILYSKSNTAYRYINTNYKQYMIHYTQCIIIAEHDINLGITIFFSATYKYFPRLLSSLIFWTDNNCVSLKADVLLQ